MKVFKSILIILCLIIFTSQVKAQERSVLIMEQPIYKQATFTAYFIVDGGEAKVEAKSIFEDTSNLSADGGEDMGMGSNIKHENTYKTTHENLFYLSNYDAKGDSTPNSDGIIVYDSNDDNHDFVICALVDESKLLGIFTQHDVEAYTDEGCRLRARNKNGVGIVDLILPTDNRSAN